MLLNAYARARLAEADGALLTAASAYREAVALDPVNVEVVRRGFRQAVLAGDKALALRSAHGLDLAGQLPRDGTILLLIDALDRRKWDEARSLIDRLEREENLAFVVPFMRSWVSLADGPYDPPVIAVDQPYAVFAVRYQEEQLLLQRLTRGDLAGALDAYAAAKQSETALGAQERAVLAVRFAQLGRRDIALELLSDSAAGGGDPALLLDQAKKRYREQRFTPQTGLAMLMYRLGLDLFGQGEGSATLSIARMASFADPSNEDVRLGVARASLAAHYPAIAYSEAGLIPANSGAWTAAQAIRLRALLDQQRDAEAVAQARWLVADKPDAQRQRLLGDILMQTDDYAGAAQAYAAARQGSGAADDPALLLQLGSALEQSGQWAQARPLLERVVELAPDSAPALNHLGYALADRGEDLPRAIALLEKANGIRPKEPAFVDSLAWALFRAGDYAKALPLAQSAAAAEPGNAEINEHVGDILWALGRRFEARYAWAAAMIGLTDDERKGALGVRIESKLEGGATAGASAAKP